MNQAAFPFVGGVPERRGGCIDIVEISFDFNTSLGSQYNGLEILFVP